MNKLWITLIAIALTTCAAFSVFFLVVLFKLHRWDWNYGIGLYCCVSLYGAYRYLRRRLS